MKSSLFVKIFGILVILVLLLTAIGPVFMAFAPTPGLPPETVAGATDGAVTVEGEAK